ncbi:MAG: serine hydrolase [Anaerolineae bacterium]|nr:serine hydrolase [Anaerolineae bacterium]
MTRHKVTRFFRSLIMFLALTLVVLLVLVTPVPALSMPPRQDVPVPSVAPSGSIAPDELESFLDAFFAAQLARTHTPGAMVVFVQDGEILLSKGYGLARVEGGRPMGATDTVVHIGSISKLFVATAVMQLVEQGQLDLHADVNRYLTAFKVDETYSQPVTLAQLLTHTAGLNERWDTSTDPSAIPPLETYLAGSIHRILPPEKVWYYSGVGYALAAYIVETVSGLLFDRYVAEQILAPLGMTRSRYLRTSTLPAGMAVGYLYQEDAYLPQSVEYYADYPSGDLVSTAEDMAQFMIAHLEGGCDGERCILRPETVAEMHSQQYSAHPQIDGHCYGFVEGSVNGQRLIGHSGAHRGFGADLTLLPEQRLGYFLAFNQECAGSLACSMIPALRQQFLDHFFPAAPEALPSPAPSTPLEQVTGKYRSALLEYDQRIRDSAYRLTILDQDVTVTAGGDGILVDGTKYVETAPLLFQDEMGEKRIAFVRDKQGKVTSMFRPPAYVKLAWYESGAFTRAMFTGWGALWAVVALVWPLALLVRRWRGGLPATRPECLEQCLLVLIGIFNVAFLLSLNRLFWISVAAMRAWLVLPLVSAGLTAASLILAGVLWWRKKGAVLRQVYPALVVLASAVFLTVLNAWNLIGFK